MERGWELGLPGRISRAENTATDATASVSFDRRLVEVRLATMVHPQAWRAEDTMTGALIGLLLLGLAGPMEVLGEDDEARFEVDFTRAVRDRDLVSLTLHMTPKTDRGYAVAHADIRVDCAAQTFTFTAFRAFDDAGAALRSADVPVERHRAEPIHEGPV